MFELDRLVRYFLSIYMCILVIVILICISLNCIVDLIGPLSGLVFNINTVKLYPSLSDTQHGDE